MDVSDLFYFFPAWGGEGEFEVLGGGGSWFFFLKIAGEGGCTRRQGFQEGFRRGRGRGAGRVSAAYWGIFFGGGPKYFFGGPKRPPSQSPTK